MTINGNVVTGKEEVVVYVNVLSQYSMGDGRKNHEHCKDLIS